MVKSEVDDDQDVEMSAAEIEALDQMESSMGIEGAQISRGSPQVDSPPPLPAGDETVDKAAPIAPQAPRRRLVITHDKYMSLQSLIVFHLSATERETGRGIDRDELIDWYLELKESEIQDVDELEYEKELITKMLKKLVKVKSSTISFPVFQC